MLHVSKNWFGAVGIWQYIGS